MVKDWLYGIMNSKFVLLLKEYLTFFVKCLLMEIELLIMSLKDINWVEVYISVKQDLRDAVNNFDWYSWYVTVVVFGAMTLICEYGRYGLQVGVSFSGWQSVSSQYFVFDLIGYNLSLLTVILSFVLLYLYDYLSVCALVCVNISMISSLFCYCSNHALLFWWWYEMSILPLLYLILKDSPYSERYVASWYLAGYVVLTSLPMLLCLLYFVMVSGSWTITDWGLFCFDKNGFDYEVSIVLGILFITKIPIVPFHNWLPIVHAEATNIVSICLSGYIMKLGLLGVCRFCWLAVPDYLLNTPYVSCAFLFSVLFFIMSSWELDSKRWLAWMSLSHIVICVVCLNGTFFNNSGLFLFYSVGHGISAALMFIYLWWCYELVGSRNWMILKSVNGGSLLFRFLFCTNVCTVASFPPLVQFFVEIDLLHDVSVNNSFFFVLFCFYLFFSSVVPLFLIGFNLSSRYCVNYDSDGGLDNFLFCMGFLIVLSFILFLCV